MGVSLPVLDAFGGSETTEKRAKRFHSRIIVSIHETAKMENVASRMSIALTA